MCLSDNGQLHLTIFLFYLLFFSYTLVCLLLCIFLFFTSFKIINTSYITSAYIKYYSVMDSSILSGVFIFTLEIKT